jgi:quinol monooxygenase YgiN
MTVMKIMVKFEMVAKPESVEKVKQFFERILPDTRNYDGCESVILSRLAEHPDKFVLVEYWESNELFQNYIKWRQEIGDFDIFGSMLSVEPDMQIFEVLTTA